MSIFDTIWDRLGSDSGTAFLRYGVLFTTVVEQQLRDGTFAFAVAREFHRPSEGIDRGLCSELSRPTLCAWPTAPTLVNIYYSMNIHYSITIHHSINTDYSEKRVLGVATVLIIHNTVVNKGPYSNRGEAKERGGDHRGKSTFGVCCYHKLRKCDQTSILDPQDLILKPAGSFVGLFLSPRDEK